MKTLHFSVHIQAPREKVWHSMLDEKTYPEWTKPFNEGGSLFQGSWEKGSKMLFLGPDPKTGEMGGMVSEVAENKPNEYLSIKHVGIVTKGVEDLTSDEARKWTPSFENYTFNEKDGGTELLIEVQTADDFADFFNEVWPKALENVKKMAERA